MPPDSATAATDPDAVAAAVDGHGFAVIRGLFQPEEAIRLRARMTELHERFFAGVEGANGIDVVHFDRILHGPLEPYAIDVIDLFLRSPGWPVFRRLIGRPVQFLMFACLVRTHLSGTRQSRVPLHQDVTFMGNAFRSFNCWIPLVDVGVDRPGLEMLRAPVREDLSSMIDDHADPASLFRDLNLTTSLDRITERYGGAPMVAPVLSAGDALVFDQLTVHRTQPGFENGGTRMSLEIRGCATGVPLNAQQSADRFTIDETPDGFVWTYNDDQPFGVSRKDIAPATAKRGGMPTWA